MTQSFEYKGRNVDIVRFENSEWKQMYNYRIYRFNGEISFSAHKAVKTKAEAKANAKALIDAEEAK